jgi:2-oxoisovalerate dehydrogenase E2 component (dihydrolipoyl transacylase)
VPAGVSSVRHFLLPDLGEGLTEAEIVAWHVAAGDEVALNQVLVDVETEKAVVELPSPFAGTVVELLAGEGDTVGVGSAIIAIDTSGAGEAATEKVPTLVGYGPSETPRSRRRRNGPRHPEQGRTQGAPAGSRPLAAPPVRFMARQNGIDLADVTGHGAGGVITREDLAAHLVGVEAAGRPTGETARRESRAPVRGVQKHMAAAMVRSVATAPQACVFLTLDVTATVELVQRLRANRHFDGLRVTPLAVVARAMVLALRDAPALNSSWDEAAAEVVTKHYVHLGVAVAGPLGLVVPNIKDAQDMTLRELAQALADLTARAREARCTPAELSGGTITLTNVGVFGVDAGVPLLNPGEAAILALGAVRRRPWELDGAVALRDVVTLSLAFDHRLVDGAAASGYLTAVGEILADPTNLIALG